MPDVSLRFAHLLSPGIPLAASRTYPPLRFFSPPIFSLQGGHCMMHQLKHSLSVVLSLAALLSLTLLVSTAAADRDYEREGRRSSTRVSERDLRSFDTFLDAHWETAQELYRDPELLNNDRFVRGHSDLRNWLEDHQDAAQAIQADPRGAIWHERTAGRGEEERRPASTRISERDLRSFEDYLNAD